MTSPGLSSLFPPSFPSWTKTKIRSSRPFFPFFLISSLAFLAQVLPLILLFSRLPRELPLFYSLPWGLPQLTSPPFLFLLPALSLIVLLTNGLFAHLLKDKFISRLLWITTTLVTVLATYTLVQILILIT